MRVLTGLADPSLPPAADPVEGDLFSRFQFQGSVSRGQGLEFWVCCLAYYLVARGGGGAALVTV